MCAQLQFLFVLFCLLENFSVHQQPKLLQQQLEPLHGLSSSALWQPLQEMALVHEDWG